MLKMIKKLMNPKDKENVSSDKVDSDDAENVTLIDYHYITRNSSNRSAMRMIVGGGNKL